MGKAQKNTWRNIIFTFSRLLEFQWDTASVSAKFVFAFNNCFLRGVSAIEVAPLLPNSSDQKLPNNHSTISAEVKRKEKMDSERRIGVAVDFSLCSKKALKWTIDNVIRKGDYLILITVRPEGDYEDGEMQLWQTTGSRKMFFLLDLVLLFLSSDLRR